MNHNAQHPLLWTLAQDRQQIDPEEMFTAIEAEARHGTLDYRTRLLIHEALQVLEKKWGAPCLQNRITNTVSASCLVSIQSEPFEEIGFPSLERRMKETTKPENILRFLRELGEHIHEPAHLAIGGSSALILAGMLLRTTEDIDVVDEVPAVIRNQQKLLKALSERHRISLTHFQSHYLPGQWHERLEYLGEFGSIKVSLVDSYDIFVGKLFSRREKDMQDLPALADQLKHSRIVQRLAFAKRHLADDVLRENAQRNWRIVYGRDLPA